MKSQAVETCELTACGLCTGGFCRRRGVEMNPRHQHLCAVNEKYADIFDRRLGVADASVRPDSHVHKDATVGAETKRSTRTVVVKRRGSATERTVKVQPASKGLGDLIGDALAAVGVTDERVSAWLGRPCPCGQRRQKLNNLARWAADVAKTPVLAARERLFRIFGDKDE